MNWFAEITSWTEPGARNHTYLLDQSKSMAYAYVKFGQGKPQVFSKPLRIDIRGRKFKSVADQWRLRLDEPQPEGRVFTVTGSKGDSYTVNEVNGAWACTCSGFKFRGACKHVKELSTT